MTDWRHAPAGEDLDAAVAELLGEVRGVTFGSWPDHKWTLLDGEIDCTRCGTCPLSIKPGPCVVPPPAYSTDRCFIETMLTHPAIRMRVPRILVARDEMGFHVRETLFTIHDGDRGEVRYDAKPLGSGDTLQLALARAIASFEST